ncbi:MAG: 1-deoxy-D-xylulose-5-phosphate reductoisomerase [Micavibrio aeruginosavorus]|uniref:1-deoxy-D-xylulose 5-phosphate reductoisomerase n=1 Tax=Micavibrio aeruginosavorus TaxID=349221 RepID=A0A2W4ZMD2_9BACT|nr:MAG: 1-deoxy-D-xylulose-5-phosphate reductoisomerase [Micavibrio aeruginosavorus]
MKKINILGSTGTVGVATLDVVAANPDLYSVGVLTAQSNVAKLAEQAKSMRAEHAVIGDETLLPVLKEALSGTGIKVSGGRTALVEASGIPADCTMAAIVGMAGLEPLLAAIANGKHVAIANKEPLVSAGVQVLEAARKSGATLLPVDSEHNAVFQVFESSQKSKIERIILTASGGPFRNWTREQMEAATPEQAVSHPNWSMGAKISVDSATMMNKALEVIEAHHLFSMPPEKIDVMLHPQSVIHAMVEYADGSVLSHMGAPDMRVPITHALGWPDRITGPAQRLDFARYSSLTFEQVHHCRFPAINYAYACMKAGQGACIAFNAANEIAVAAFLEGRIKFTDIFDIVRRTVEEGGAEIPSDLASVLALDSRMRSKALSYIVNESGRQPTQTDRKAS